MSNQFVRQYEQEARRLALKDYNMPLEAENTLWAKTTSVALACEPQFFDFMRNPFRRSAITLKPVWLASIVLEGRYTRYSSFNNWNRYWMTKERRDSIIIEAIMMFNQAVKADWTDIEKTTLEHFEDDAITKEKRLGLAQLLGTRAKLLSTIKTSQVYNHAPSLPFVTKH